MSDVLILYVKVFFCCLNVLNLIQYLKDNSIVFIMVGDANQINMEHLRSISSVVLLLLF